MKNFSTWLAYGFISFVIVIGSINIYTTKKQQKNIALKPEVHVTITDVPIQSSKYSIDVNIQGNTIQPHTPKIVLFTIRDSHNAIVKDFLSEHEKLLHFVVLRKDLQYFQHLHPQYNQKTGEFSQLISFPTDGPYVLYADFIPKETNSSEVIMTNVTIGDIKKYLDQPVISDGQLKKEVGPYMVKFFLTPVKNEKVKGLYYSIYVEKSGSPVVDLQPYLGALAHSILINTQTFEYVHTHAVDSEHMDGMNMGSDPSTKGPWINFQTAVPRAGTYKIFTEFEQQGIVTVADFTISL
jgi:hypothetical protein